MFVGIGGRVGGMNDIAAYCRERGIKFILDAAHMAGTKLHGTQVGQDADAVVFSFQAVKNLPTADSGLLATKDEKLYLKAKALSWLGIDKDTYTRSSREGTYKWEYDVPDVGFKYNGNSVMAAMAIVGLRHLDEDNDRRRKILEMYQSAFRGKPINVVVEPSSAVSASAHLAQILIDDRDAFIDFMAEAKIYCGVHYLPNNEFAMYKKFNRTPVASYLARRIATLPCHLGLSDNDVQRVIDRVYLYVK
jgi:dTDP-4-amino-4,6-dideoxygalactose transaminase